MNKRVKDILTEEELSEVHRLNKGIMKASTKTQIRYYRQEISKIINGAKERHFKSKNNNAAVKNKETVAGH